MRFVQFLLNEARVDDNNRLRITPLETDDQLVQYLIQHASDAKWMFQEDYPVWRGISGSVLTALKTNTGVVVDPTLSERKSETISNHYTLLLDNHPERVDWPKRSRSLIAGTTLSIAGAYGMGHRVIPLNGSKIGYVNTRDIWDSQIQLTESSTIELTSMNTVWDAFGQPSNWDNWKDAASATRLDNESVKGDLNDLLESNAIGSFDWDEMLNYLNVPANGTVLSLATAMYSNDHIIPEQSWGTTKSGKPTRPSTELWIGGPAVMIAKWASWNDISDRVLEGLR